ncbi:MAG: TIGR03435 family protein [Acidobacteriota bacterium]
MMKVFLFALASVGILSAQAMEIVGTWQGTLVAGQQQIRTVIKIGREGGNLSAVLYTIDQNPQPNPAGTTTFQGSTLKFAIPSINVTYEGRMAADGNSINGSATQGNTPLPLVLTRSTPATAWAIPEPPPPPVQLAANANIHVEVATVKPGAANARGRLYTMRGELVLAINVSLMNLITFSYDVHERQVSGAPSWADSDKFDITVKPDMPGQPNITQMKKLFKEVLADRFQLKFHTEKRDISVYAITLPAGTQHKLTKSAANSNIPSLAYPRAGMLPARNATITELAQSMQSAVLDRPVIDRTGIEGRYDFTIDWMPDETQFASFGPPQAIPDNGKPDIFKAYQEQLGLKIEGVRAPADVLVLDKTERPSDN